MIKYSSLSYLKVVGVLLLPSMLVAEEQVPNATQLIMNQLIRTWVDDSGYHHVEGQLVTIGRNSIRLLKQNGKYATVPLTRLSLQDRKHVQSVRALHLNAGETTSHQTHDTEPRDGLIYLTVSREYLQRLTKPIEDEGPLVTNLFGVPVQGIAQTHAVLGVNLVDDNGRAVLELPITGTIETHTTASASIAEVYTSGSTDFRKRIRLTIDSSGARIQPSATWSHSDFVTTGIATSARLLRRMVLRMADQQVRLRKAMNDAEAARILRLRVDQQFDDAAQELAGRLDQAIKRASREFAETEALRGMQLGFATTPSHMEVAVNLPRRAEVTSPPSIDDVAAPLVLRVHSSALPDAVSEGARQELQEVLKRLSAVLPNGRDNLQAILADTDVHVNASDDGSWLVLHLVPSQPPASRTNDEIAMAH